MTYYFEQDIKRKRNRFTFLYLFVFIASLFTVIINSYKYFSIWYYIGCISGFVSYVAILLIRFPKNSLKEKVLNVIFSVFILLIIFFGKRIYFQYRFNNCEKVNNIAVVYNTINSSRYQAERVEIYYYYNLEKIVQTQDNFSDYKIGDSIPIIHSTKNPELFKIIK